MRGLASAAPPGGPAPAPAAAHRPAGGCPGPTRPLPRPRAGPAFPRPPLPSAHFLPHAPRPRPAAAICTRDEVRSPEVPPPRLEPPSRGRGGAPGAPAPRPGRVRRRGASGCVSGCSSNQLACTRCPKGRPSPGGSRRPAACARLLGGGCAIVSRVRLKLVLLFCAVPVVVALLAWPPWKAGRGSPGALATERPAGGAAPRGAQAANRRPCMWGQPNPLGMWALPAPTDRAASTLLHAHACAGACGRLRMIMNPQSSDRLGRVEATCMRKRGRLQWRDRPAPSRVRAGGSQSVPQQAVQKGSAGGAKGPRAGWSAGELAASQVGARERAAALRARTGGTGGHMQAWARASGVSWRSPGSCRRCP
jgi:hypothetical protein